MPTLKQTYSDVSVLLAYIKDRLLGQLQYPSGHSNCQCAPFILLLHEQSSNCEKICILNEMSLQASRPCGQFLNPRVCLILILYPFYFYFFAVIITMHRRGIYLGLEVKKKIIETIRINLCVHLSHFFGHMQLLAEKMANCRQN